MSTVQHTSRRYRELARALFLASCIGLIACSGTERDDDEPLDDAGVSADAGEDNERPDASQNAANGDDAANGDAAANGDDATNGDDTGLPPSSGSKAAYCEGLSQDIRDARGEIIEVEPGPNGQVVVDGTEMTLRQAVSRAGDGDTVLLADGTYTFPANADGSAFTGVYITTPNVTLRSASGDPTAVVIDSNYFDHGNGSAPITVAAPGVTIADLTVKRSIYHLVHLWEDGDQATLHNLRLVDGGQQFVKSSGGNDTIDDVTVTCSHFLMTDAGRDNVWGYGARDGNTTCYTGGIDSHEGQGWIITDNLFRGIYCDAQGVQRPAHGKNADARGGQTYQGGLAEHAVHMWDSPEGGGGHLIARNHIVDCARGIGLGFRDQVFDVVVRNNMIFSSFAASREHDVGISAERAQNTSIVHNTVFYAHPDAYPDSIEYRWESTSNLSVLNNLTDGRIRSRDGAGATLDGNVTAAEASWFVDTEAADLHLADCDLSEVAGVGVPAGESMVDFDHDPRDISADVGADECR